MNSPSLRRAVRALALLTIPALLTGCPAAKSPPEPAPTLIVRGSNTIGEELAPALAAAFKKRRPGVAFDFEFKGTTYGFGALMAGRADIAAASRPVSTNELKLAADRGITLADALIGSYAVAVVVNAGNPVARLTPEQVKGLFTGALQNWKEVGGPDQPVAVHIRDLVSGTHLGFQELAMDREPYALTAQLHPSYEAIGQAVAAQPNAVGFTSLPVAGQPGVKAVAIGDVAPTFEAVQQGRYPFARKLHLFTDQTKATPLAREFVQFALSAEGQQVLRAGGFVPVP